MLHILLRELNIELGWQLDLSIMTPLGPWPQMALFIIGVKSHSSATAFEQMALIKPVSQA